MVSIIPRLAGFEPGALVFDLWPAVERSGGMPGP